MQLDAYVKGKPMQGVCEEIRLFNLCRNMKWAHLPNAGGIYNQDPELMERFQIIFAAINEHEAEEHRKQEREREQNSRQRGGRMKSRSR